MISKISAFRDHFASEQRRWIAAGRPKKIGDFVDRKIKWTSELEAHLARGSIIELKKDRIFESQYRPFVRRPTYFAPIVTHRVYQNTNLFSENFRRNPLISVSRSRRSSFAILATDTLPNTDMFAPDVGQVFARYRLTKTGETIDNITDWSFNRFHDHYEKGKGRRARPLTKDAIFNYVYGVLHDPVYREKYALNLKREFPRIPFYADVWRWADWGAALMRLHIEYQQVAPFALVRTDVPDDTARKVGVVPKAILRANKDAGTIMLDSETTLYGIPAIAWTYLLGNRSAIDWVLDQHKEKTPKDPTIREKFNTYRFANQKEKVVDLLKRVTTVSVETMRIVGAMRTEPRGKDYSSTGA